MLDRVDVGILRALLTDVEAHCFQTDPRQSYDAVARALGVSADTVVRRIRRLERSGFLRGLPLGLNPNLFGWGATFVYFECADEDERARVLESVRAVPGVLWIVTYLGTSAGFLIPHPTLHLRPQDLLAQAPGLAHARVFFTTDHSFPSVEGTLSPTDWRIIRALGNQPRRRYSTIAKGLGLSGRTVRRRLSRIVADRIFFTFPDFDLSRLEGAVMASLAVSFTDGVAKRRFEERLLPLLRNYYLVTPSKEPMYAAYICVFPNLPKAEELRLVGMILPGVQSIMLRHYIVLENFLPREFRAMTSRGFARVAQSQRGGRTLDDGSSNTVLGGTRTRSSR